MATEERSGQQGQHPPSPQGAGASLLYLAGADIFLSVSLVSLVSSFFFFIEPLIKKKKNLEESQIQGTQSWAAAAPAGSPFLGVGPMVVPWLLGFCPKAFKSPDSKPHQVALLSRAQPGPHHAGV